MKSETVIQEYTKDILNLITDAMDNDLSLQWLKDKIEIETSLEYVEKEKQQIIEAVDETMQEMNLYESFRTLKNGEQYYNQTFKQD